MQDIFFSDTCQFADVVLPASPSLEKEGTFTSTERRIQRLYQVFEPLPGSRPDWVIIQDVANRLGAGWNYRHPSEVMDEVAALTPMFAGVNYERLEGYKSLQWPVAADGTRSAAALHEGLRVPRREGPPVSARLARTAGVQRRRVRPAFEQRPPARTFSRGQSDLSQPRHPRKNSRHLRRGIAGAGTRARYRERQPGAAHFAATASVRVRALVTDRVQDGELYMPMNSTDQPRQSAHRQPHGPRDAHAGIQGDSGSHGGAAPRAARVRCRASITASAIPLRRTAWKWNENGGSPAIASRASWCRSRRRGRHRIPWRNRFH